MHLRPGVACVLVHPAIHHQIAADIACGDRGRARGGNKDIGMILANALADRDGLNGGGRRFRLPHLVGNGPQNRRRQRMHPVENRVAFPNDLGQRFDLVIRSRQRGRLHEMPKRRAAIDPAKHARCVMSFDETFCGNHQLAHTDLGADQIHMVSVMIHVAGL